MTKYLKELGPTTFSICKRWWRCIARADRHDYIARKHNPNRVKFPDPRMKDITDQSYGVITYQDDVLLTAIKLAGYSWEEADKFRKPWAKTIPEKWPSRKRSLEGIVANGGKEELSRRTLDLIEPFAPTLNKAHAASYAIVAYHTAYMKAHFPAE